MTNRFAIIKNGVVVNTVLSTPEFAAKQQWVACGAAGPGWLYDGQTFTPPAPTEQPTAAAPTKEQLMAELAALTAKIQALE